MPSKLMMIRTVLTLLLLLPAAASAQDLDAVVSAVVRISGTRDGTPVRGSGFVVGLDHDTATIVTSSHVIEGVETKKIEVVFAGSPQPFPADVILGLEAGNPRGLAVFQVRGAIPAGVTVLSFETERPHLGEALLLLGFPQMALSPRMTQRVLSGRDGTWLLIDQEIGEGFSGGPVLKGGKVVGVVTDTDDQTTYAVSALVAREALEGWRVKLGGQSSAPATSTATQSRTVPASPNPFSKTKSFTFTERMEMNLVAQILGKQATANELKTAFDLARKVADAHPESKEAQQLAGEAAFRISRWSDAVTYFRREGDTNEKEPEQLLHMAIALYESGDKTSAARILQIGLPNLRKTAYVAAYSKKILGPPCTSGEERTLSGVVFVRICPGLFTMGSAQKDPRAFEDEKPAHLVALSEFWISQTEITNAQYQRFRLDHQGNEMDPASSVSWEDADATCKLLGGSLPTEAQWEYAARAGSQTAWSFGDDEAKLGSYAWYGDNSHSPHPWPVGEKKPNPWGLYDMHGNVWEWTADWYGPYPSTEQIDPTGPETGTYRVLRGGSTNNAARFVRSAVRFSGNPTGVGAATIGFRCARPPQS